MSSSLVVIISLFVEEKKIENVEYIYS